ncbi:hypothetical protein [Kordia jejudonensis]|uniref:hypothetical protein n=1 Tax=Kordia jejudonensis TaxID=1348245 RepID=UPI0006294BD4|nr:hypothetical protein [Kordia jejudonensis]
MKKKFFLHKTVDALTEKQINDLNSVFGGLSQGASDTAVGLPYDDDIHIPTGGGGPRCPYGYYWNHYYGRCFKEGDYPHDVAVASPHEPMHV